MTGCRHFGRIQFLTLTVLFLASTSWAQRNETVSEDQALVGESAENLQDQSMKDQSRWTGIYTSQSMTWLKDQQTFGAQAPIGSDEYIAVDYKLSPMWTMELGYNFTLVNNNRYAYQPYYSTTGFVAQDPQLTFKQTLGRIGRSDPVSLLYTLFFPAGNIDRTVRGGNGTFRFDALTNFPVSRRWTLMPAETVRIYLNNANDALGNNAVYRFNLGGAALYNFSKTFNAYVWPQFDLRSTAFNYSALQFNVMNRYQTELGLNYTFKAGAAAITVNPAIINYIYLDNGQGLAQASYSSSDPNGYVPTTEIDFNVSATF